MISALTKKDEKSGLEEEERRERKKLFVELSHVK